MANMTAREQLMLELINRARLDPRAEADRLDVALGSAEGKAVPVLAGNDALRASAFNHSSWMILNDTFSRNESRGSTDFIAETPLGRMKAYGYKVSGPYHFAENISWKGSPEMPDFTLSIIAQHEGLFANGGSRARLLDKDYREVGIGQQAGTFSDETGTFITSMVTQDFIGTGGKVFITGVVYNDIVVDNDFYDVGEGVAGLRVRS
ncbi:MAG TPA: CAP domain-containing protein, partial [Devosia sp.]|nr:CAP domain-containing protein [Devosia sp.]